MSSNTLKGDVTEINLLEKDPPNFALEVSEESVLLKKNALKSAQLLGSKGFSRSDDYHKK
jgi:hypothetical protein